MPSVAIDRPTQAESRCRFLGGVDVDEVTMTRRMVYFLKVVLVAMALGVSCIALDSSATAGVKQCVSGVEGESGECVASAEGLDEKTLKKVLDFHGGKVTVNKLAYGVHDHLECDIETLGLSDEQKQLVMEAYNSPNVQDPALLKLASTTDFRITPHTAYRYFASAGWTEKYHGEFVNDSIVETVKWRSEYGLYNIDATPMIGMIERGLCYVDNELDKGNRPTVYIKTANLTGSAEDLRDYVKLLMFTINRAEMMATSRGIGEFVAIIDMDGFSWSKSPTVASLKELMANLKMHFPYRLQAVYIVNTSMAFSMLWKIFKPILPKRAIDKTHILSKRETEKALEEKVGLENVEVGYGGQKPSGYAITDIAAYLDPAFVKGPSQ